MRRPSVQYRGFMLRPSRLRLSRPGLTLVELLVVLGIVGLLFALILPVIAAARQAGRSTVCGANLREIGIATTSRSLEHNGYAQPAGTIELPPVFVAGDDLGPAIGDPDRTRYTYSRWGNPMTGSLWETLVPFPQDLRAHLSSHEEGLFDPDNHLFTCPSELPDTAVQFVEYRIGATVHFLADPDHSDYTVNEGVFGVSRQAGSHARLRGNLSRIRETSSIVLLSDAQHIPSVSPFVYAPRPDAPAASSLEDCFADPQPAAYVDKSAVPALRHRDGANVLYADAHVVRVGRGHLSNAVLVP